MNTSKMGTLANVRGDSAEFRRLNPHLFTPEGAQKAPKALISANPSPVSPQKGIRTAPKPKTRPEREMFAILRHALGQGEFSEFGFETMTLEIGDGVTYKPDFTVWLHDGTLRFVEVKGPFIREDALNKWKCAKGRYKLAEWQLWQLLKSGWTRIA